MNKIILSFVLLSLLASCRKEEPEFIRRQNEKLETAAMAPTFFELSQSERERWIKEHQFLPPSRIGKVTQLIPQ